MRYPRTIVFVDLSGFTAYIGRTDDDAAIAMLKTFRETARDLASEVGVRIDKHLGDGLMAIATDQNSGVIFAMELQRRFGEQREELNLRIGIASGDIILFQGEDYIGTAPNLAARLCDEAARYGILMPTYQAINLPDGVIAEPVGEFTLQGFEHPVPASRLVGIVPAKFRNDTEEHWTRTPFAM
jgi:class 3 adenylate cyclase